jgi:hypothetical protein
MYIRIFVYAPLPILLTLIEAALEYLRVQRTRFVHRSHARFDRFIREPRHTLAQHALFFGPRRKCWTRGLLA